MRAEPRPASHPTSGRDLEPGALAGVGAHDRRPAGVGDDRHAAAARAGAGGTAARAASNISASVSVRMTPACRKQRVHGDVGGGHQRAGVRAGRPARPPRDRPLLTATIGLRRPTRAGDAPEPPRVAERLQVEQHHVGRVRPAPSTAGSRCPTRRPCCRRDERRRGRCRARGACSMTARPSAPLCERKRDAPGRRRHRRKRRVEPRRRGRC